MDVIDTQFYDQCLQEWCCDNPEYKTSFKNLASILGKTEIETERIAWRFQEPLSLVTEVSTMAYLKCKDDIKRKAARQERNAIAHEGEEREGASSDEEIEEDREGNVPNQQQRVSEVRLYITLVMKLA